jgi:DNA-binding NtrC family response regulator
VTESEELQGSGTVLIVEDNPQVGDVSTLLLEQLGYKAVRVDRPKAALALLAKPNAIDMVFTDIVMPGDMDGLGLAREIQAQHPKLPVLLATGYSSAAERAGGEFPILRKPYDQRTLGIAIKGALAGSGLKQPVSA